MSNVRIDDMRCAVAAVYSGRKWKVKVDRMSDRQVMALYYRFYHSGKLEDGEPKKTTEHKEESPKFDPYRGEQMKFEGLD